MSGGGDFLWGTAVSAHQVEGGNLHNDWYGHERQIAPAERACDFWRLFEEDLDRARALGTNAFRLSLEWSRLEPREGERDPAAEAHYARMLAACRARGLAPVVTLVHFTLPRWCARAGGWLAEETERAFERHVRFVARRFGGEVERFVTVNEPNVQAGAGYLSGVFPPGRRFRPDLARRCERALFRAHERAYRVLHEEIPRVAVGASPHVIAWRRSALDPGGFARRAGARFNWSFLDAAARAGALDFVGLNYFMALPANFLYALRFAGFLKLRARRGTSDMGWPVDARRLEEALLEAWRRYARPIVVTENGVADAADALRPAYLESHLAALARARAAGADVRGYFHWSLLDNFEWHAGYGPRFGLYAVDYATQERTLRPSGAVYARLIARAGGRAPSGLVRIGP